MALVEDSPRLSRTPGVGFERFTRQTFIVDAFHSEDDAQVTTLCQEHPIIDEPVWGEH